MCSAVSPTCVDGSSGTAPAGHKIRKTALSGKRLENSLGCCRRSTKEEKTFKRNSMSATGICGAVRVAETDPRISILAAELDSHPELINTPSGIVDLRTGTVKPHDPDLLLTRITAYPVNLEGPHPQWDAFLKETFDGDADLISYMQRLAGLALLGNVHDHILPFLHGVGATAKA